MKMWKCNLNKRQISAIALSLLILNPLSIYADTVTGLKILNNTDRNIDYKLDEESVKNVKDKVNTKSDHTEVFDKDAGRNISSENKQLSYLIENNIISREETITVKPDGITVQNTSPKTDGDISKSQFLMGMYKSIYGPIDSRPLVVNTPSIRNLDGEDRQLYTTTTKPKDYNGNATNFEYKEGDYQTFVSSNVVELYLNELLNKSIIDMGELRPEVVDEMELRASGDKTPAWDNNLPAYKPLEGQDTSKAQGGTPFGRSFFIGGYPEKMSSLDIHKDESAQYFNNEKIQTIEALEIIEDVLRLTEKDLSKMEADLVAYKFGTSYILDFPKETRDTITYLIAMGVLDFENPGEFGNIYDDLSNSFAHTLMYRLHNKSGRKDFSKIQLTDSEDQLLKEGFVEQELKKVEKFEGAMPPTLGVYKGGVEQQIEQPNQEGSSLDSPDDSSLDSPEGQPSVEMTSNTPVKPNGILDKTFELLGFSREDRGVKFARGKTKTTNYEVVKLFIDQNNTRYKGTRIAGLNQDQHDEIKEIKDVDGGRQITFTVSAPSAVQAIASIDSRITITSDSASEKGNVNTITQVNTEGGKISYISAKELGNSISEIAVINSKTLKNKKTGDMAMLLKDHKLALVGNTIIKSGADMVTRLNGVEYYNLDMIVPLMTNSYISKIDPAKLYTNVVLPEELIVPVRGAGGNVVEHVPITQLGNNQPEGSNPLLSKSDSKYFYNVNLITKGVSTLIRDFDISHSGKNVEAKVIVNWHYSLPKTNSTENKENLIEDPKIKNMAEKDEDFSVKGATDYLYTRPESGALQDWWDNNIELSNGIANLMYGTNEKPQRYVSSGYMTPSIDILVSDMGVPEDTIIREIFGDMKLPASYVNKYLNGNIREFHKILFNKTGNGLNARRTLNIYQTPGKGSDQGVNSYADNYVTYPTGAVYKRVFGDSRLKFVITPSDKYVELHSRAKESMQNIDSQKVEVIGKDGNPFVMYFSGYSGTNKDGNYIRLTTMEPLAGRAKKDGDKWSIHDDNNQDMVKAFHETIDNLIPKSMQREKIPDNLWTIIPPKEEYTKVSKKGKEHYLVNNSLKEVTTKTKDGKTIKGEYTVKTIDESDKTVYAHPTLYLKRSEFRFKEISNGKDGVKYRLVMERTNPYLEQSNVFYSGLNNSLISRILDEDTNAVPLKKLPSGAKVIMQGMNWTKVGNALHSDPVTDTGMVSRLTSGVRAGKESSGLEKEVLMLFQGLSMTYSGREAKATNGQIPFSSYVTYAGLGGIEHLEDVLIDNTMFKQGSNVKIAKDKGNIVNMRGDAVPTSATVAVATDNNVLYRLIDKENKVYELVTNSDRYAEGYLDNVSMFYETLDLGSMDDLFLTLQGNKFFGLDSADKYINEMLQEYQKALRGDGEQILKQICVVFLSLAIVMSWLVYGILQLNVGKNILLSLREALETDTSKGLDVIKLATFGLLSLDSELKSSTLFVGNLAMFTLLYFVLNRF